MNKRWIFLSVGIVLGLVIFTAAFILNPFKPAGSEFSGSRALANVNQQVSFGPRTPGSSAHSREVEWIQTELTTFGWTVEIQETEMLNHPVRNIIAKRGKGSPWIILGAHFDTRFIADQDPNPDYRQTPVPGANDGASGVAVLLELARTIPPNLPKQVWLVFFDAEDQGRIPNWDWILGSEAFAASLTNKPDSVVIVDMIGDANLNIYKEKNSNQELTNEIWQIAKNLGYDQQFIAKTKYSMLDDHTPFLNREMRAIDIIDFDYPYWHTTQDITDKVSAQSLEAVGRTLSQWLTQP